MTMIAAAQASASCRSVWPLAGLGALLVWASLAGLPLIAGHFAWPLRLDNAIIVLIVWALPVLAALVTRLQRDDLQNLRRWRLLILLVLLSLLATYLLALALTSAIGLLLVSDAPRTLVYAIIPTKAFLLEPLVAAWVARLALRLSLPSHIAGRPGVIASMLAIGVAITLGVLYGLEPALSQLLATHFAETASQTLAMPLKLAAALPVSLPVTLALWPLLRRRAIAAGRVAIACGLIATAGLWLAKPLAALLPDVWSLAPRVALLFILTLMMIFVACAALLRLASRPRLPA